MNYSKLCLSIVALSISSIPASAMERKELEKELLETWKIHGETSKRMRKHQTELTKLEKIKHSTYEKAQDLRTELAFARNQKEKYDAIIKAENKKEYKAAQALYKEQVGGFNNVAQIKLTKFLLNAACSLPGVLGTHFLFLSAIARSKSLISARIYWGMCCGSMMALPIALGRGENHANPALDHKEWCLKKMKQLEKLEQESKLALSEEKLSNRKN